MFAFIKKVFITLLILNGSLASIATTISQQYMLISNRCL